LAKITVSGQELMSAWTKWVNPYKLLLGDFPGRLFCCDEVEQDGRVLAALISRVPKLYCEIGSGSGNHMLELGRREPDALICGFEVRYKRAVRTIQKAQAQNIGNVIVLRTKGEAIDQFFPASSLDGVFVNFPDPWNKGKWKKHQVLGAEFLKKMDLVLKPQGFISVKSDHQEYVNCFLEEVELQGLFAAAQRSEDLYSSEYLGQNIPTEFEDLFRSKSMPIHYVRLVRTNIRGKQ
jgi:tRNA (guanine-N7-)-methyltransferase